MTRKIGKLLVIEVERGAKCEDCGKMEELRPYDPPKRQMAYLEARSLTNKVRVVAR